MSLDEKAVRHVATLAGLELPDSEVEKVKRELNEILGYVERLQAVDTRGVIPTSHVHGSVNAFREDVIKPSLVIEEVSSNAPDFTSGGFRVPKII